MNCYGCGQLMTDSAPGMFCDRTSGEFAWLPGDNQPGPGVTVTTGGNTYFVQGSEMWWTTSDRTYGELCSTKPAFVFIEVGLLGVPSGQTATISAAAYVMRWTGQYDPGQASYRWFYGSQSSTIAVP
jgi:hypothetical protein